MSADVVQNVAPSELLARMVTSKQLSAGDAHILAQYKDSDHPIDLQSEAEILQWLAKEYSVAFTSLEEVEPDKQVLSLFPARILLKE